MVSLLEPGLRPQLADGSPNYETKGVPRFLLPPNIRHRLNLHRLTSSFPSKPSSTAPSLLPSPFPPSAPVGVGEKRPAEEEVDERLVKKARYATKSNVNLTDCIPPSEYSDADDEHSDSADSASGSEEENLLATPPQAPHTPAAAPAKGYDFSLTARQAGYIYNPRRSMIDLTNRFASPTSEDEDCGESDFSDTPSSKRRALTPKPAPAKQYNFNLTAKEAGYVYNPRKSMINLTNRFASSSESDDTDDSESDFESTPNPTPSPTPPAAAPASLLPLTPTPLPLPQWKYRHQIDPINPTTPPSAGTKRKMEQSYAQWRQGEPDGARHPSFAMVTSPSDTSEFELVEAMESSPSDISEFDQVDEMEASPLQYLHQEQQRQREFSRAPSYSPITPQVQQTSAVPTSASQDFPADLPSPTVPIRLEPHSPVLDRLTAQFNAEGPHPNIPHVNHAIVDQVIASETLGKHVLDRMPFVLAASRRLQAVIGVRNDLPFDLLMGSGQGDAENLVVGANGTLVDLGLRNLNQGLRDGMGEQAMNGNGSGISQPVAATRRNAGVTADAAGSNQENMGTNTDSNNNDNANLEYSPDTTAQYLQNIHASLNGLPSSASQQQPMGNNTTQQSEARETRTFQGMTPFFPPSVDRHTGQGLREYLLTRALITGSKKRECRSISFHDFTPDLRTGEFRNELLVHFGVDGISRNDRIECVELSLPDANGILHPWLSIFIQRPLITLDPPYVGYASHSAPPNFPQPTPTSWLCMAVPLANITSYPVQADTSLPSSLLEETLIKNKHGLPTKKIAKRQDYDMSFQGVPIFEFSTRKLFGATYSGSSSNGEMNGDANENGYTNTPISDFLSVDGLKPYDPKDPYEEFPIEITSNPEYMLSICRRYARKSGIHGQELQHFGEMMEDASGIDISEELSPNEGVWWNTFYRGITKDRVRWEKVRRSMGRGRCRVVVRWQDIPEELKMPNSSLSQRTTEVEILMENMIKESMQGKKRKFRNDGIGMAGSGSGQGVGLGVINANIGAHAYSMRSASGEALSLRAKAIGNRMNANGRMNTNVDMNGSFRTQNSGDMMQGRMGDFRG
ncbi:hypothetical protein NHQ30_002899 [Ciborinia camelliae]|nr:hypothetical protein NHQ30_002899 [Ciborinia camelliae]